MHHELTILTLTAASLGFFHTLLGPDHYIPFVVMAKARKWSCLKTVIVTFLCGIGHVGSSVVLGLAGVALGIAVSRLEGFEAIRGSWAGWFLSAFGLVYSCYGIRQVFKNKPHTHLHDHGDGQSHFHRHTHQAEHAHPHAVEGRFEYTPWILFVIFIFGPCEPLIPLVMYPAAQHHFFAVVMLTAVFSAVTLATMLAVVLVGVFGLNFISLKRFERFGHALAGMAILICGVAVQCGL